jgi:hypothetical protein
MELVASLVKAVLTGDLVAESVGLATILLTVLVAI